MATYRSLALDEEGELTALDQEQFNQLSDIEALQGPSLPGLLQAVYSSAADTVDVADSTISKGPCIGFGSALLPGGKLLVRSEGLLDGFVGLVPGETYYLDPNVHGAITNLYPPGPYAPGTVQQEVGTAFSVTELKITLDADVIQQA